MLRYYSPNAKPGAAAPPCVARRRGLSCPLGAPIAPPGDLLPTPRRASPKRARHWAFFAPGAALALLTGPGCRDKDEIPVESPAQDSESVADPCAVLTARASVSRSEGRVPFSPSFDGASSCGPNPISVWQWDIGGQTLYGSSVRWTGLSAGTVQATLTVQDVFGATASTTLSVEVYPQSCPEVLPAVVLGNLADDALIEASGLVVSRRDPEVLWSHNDSGHSASLFALGRDGRALGTWTLPVTDGDWEDIAWGMEGSTPLLFVGDIGNNDGTRDSLTVYVLEEPTVDASAAPEDHAVTALRTLTLRLPEALSADTLLVDPDTGDLLILSDDNTGRTVILRKPAPHVDGDDVALEAVGELSFGAGALSGDLLLTGGDISPEGDRVVLRTREEAWLWLRDGSKTVAETLQEPPCPVPLPTEPLGEAIAFDIRDGGVLSTSEGAHEALSWVPFEEPPECFSTLEAVMTVSPDHGVVPLALSLDASESCAPAGVASVEWSLDGQTLSGEQASWTLFAAGSYPITLTLTDTLGAVDVASATVEVVQGECPFSNGSASLGTVSDEELTEVSGVAVGRRDSEVLWVHNDSGHSPRIFAINRAGDTLGTWTLSTPRGDFEDIAAGFADNGTPELWIGDIGDNLEARASVALYRFDEPEITDSEPTDHTVTDFDTITLTYPDGPRNAETLLVDPITRDIFIVTKDYDGLSDVYRKAAPHVPGESATLEHVRSFVFGEGDLAGGKPTTGGEISANGAWIVVRTYNTTAYMWQRELGASVAEALDGTPCPVELPSEPQGESVCFDVGDEALISISERENQPINRTPLLR